MPWTAKVPVESVAEPRRVLATKTSRAGVALNPGTPVERLGKSLANLDFVLLMSVHPGFAGQDFLPHVLDKARRLRAMIAERELAVDLEMDGGIRHDNIRQVVAAGVETCVAGSAAFADPDPAAAMRRLRQQAQLDEA